MAKRIHSWIRRVTLRRRVRGMLRPNDRALMDQVGDQPIARLVIVRTPMTRFVHGLTDAIAMRRLSAFLSSHQEYDQIFHLSIWINNQFRLEKAPVVKFKASQPPSTAELFEIALPQPLTIHALFDATRDHMGLARFSEYDAFDNNCQHFVMGILEANNLVTPEATHFTYQDPQEVLRALPPWVQAMLHVLTAGAERFDHLRYGNRVHRPLLSQNGSQAAQEQVLRYFLDYFQAQ